MNTDDLQLLHEHYKDTCSVMHAARLSRDRYLYTIVAVLVVVLFDLYSPRAFSTILSDWISKQSGSKLAPDLRYVRSVIWFLMLGLTVRHCQASLFIERQYGYLHALEEQLAAHFPAPAFTREGKAYLAGYPVFTEWAHRLYTMVFPGVLLLIVIVRTVRELPCCHWWSGLDWFDLLVGIALAFSLLLYLFAFHQWTIPWRRRRR